MQNEIGAVDASGKIIEHRILGEGLGAEIGASLKELHQMSKFCTVQVVGCATIFLEQC